MNEEQKGKQPTIHEMLIAAGYTGPGDPESVYIAFRDAVSSGQQPRGQSILAAMRRAVPQAYETTEHQ